MKPNQLILAAVAGVLFIFPAWAADDAATNSTEAAEIEALKLQIQELDQKVQALERQRKSEPPAAIADRCGFDEPPTKHAAK